MHNVSIVWKTVQDCFHNYSLCQHGIFFVCLSVQDHFSYFMHATHPTVLSHTNQPYTMRKLGVWSVSGFSYTTKISEWWASENGLNSNFWGVTSQRVLSPKLRYSYHMKALLPSFNTTHLVCPNNQYFCQRRLLKMPPVTPPRGNLGKNG